MEFNSMGKLPVRVAVTGAAGQIGYSLLFRIARGDMLGSDQPIILQLLDLPASSLSLRGVVMELEDCAFPLLTDIIATDNPEVAFRDADYAILVGARPRSKGMERSDLLQANGAIFSTQGRALDAVASRSCKILVVGNPANTNAYIAMQSAPGLAKENFTAMLRLDHNRAVSQIAGKIKTPVSQIERLVVWGNHSPTMYPDIRHVLVGGKPLRELFHDDAWRRDHFVPTVAKRGAAILDARGLSSAASAANAAIDHIRDWVLGTHGKWVTMGIRSEGDYGIPEGVVYGSPVVCENQSYKLVRGLEIDSETRERMDISLKELQEERSAFSI